MFARHLSVPHVCHQPCYGFIIGHLPDDSVHKFGVFSCVQNLSNYVGPQNNMDGRCLSVKACCWFIKHLAVDFSETREFFLSLTFEQWTEVSRLKVSRCQSLLVYELNGFVHMARKLTYRTNSFD